MPSLRDHPLFHFRELATGKVASIAEVCPAGRENPAMPKSLSMSVTVQLEASVKENTEKKVFFWIFLDHLSQSGT
jgi:hypothetical protein